MRVNLFGKLLSHQMVENYMQQMMQTIEAL